MPARACIYTCCLCYLVFGTLLSMHRVTSCYPCIVLHRGTLCKDCKGFNLVTCFATRLIRMHLCLLWCVLCMNFQYNTRKRMCYLNVEICYHSSSLCLLEVHTFCPNGGSCQASCSTKTSSRYTTGELILIDMH